MIVNFYFSHMLNCIYDCRYCFLQGMYRSANYLLFVNYEDFMSEIHSTAKEHEKLGENSYFFSGYDCDSMALDSITGFLEEFLPFFEQNPKAFLELRTKSIAIKQLLNRKPFENCVVAFSLSPDSISKAVEYKVPPLKNRIQALKQLANAGWKIGLRFDPLIYANNFNELYQELFEMVFANLPNSQLHSISLGPLRFPKAMFDRVQKLYPKEKLFAFPMEKRLGSYSYPQEIEENMTISIKEMLSKYADQEKFFKCSPL